MAHLQLDARNNRFLIRFRFAGVEYKRSLKTDDEVEAQTIRLRAEETIRLLERGRLELPEECDVAAFILSDGKRTAIAKVSVEYLCVGSPPRDHRMLVKSRPTHIAEYLCDLKTQAAVVGKWVQCS